MEGCYSPGNSLCQGAFTEPLSFVKQTQEQAVLQTEKYKNSVRATLLLLSFVPLWMITEIFLKCSLKTQKNKNKTTQFPLCPHVLAGRMGLLLVVSRCKETDHKLIGRTLLCTLSQLQELLCPAALSHKNWSIFLHVNTRSAWAVHKAMGNWFPWNRRIALQVRHNCSFHSKHRWTHRHIPAIPAGRSSVTLSEQWQSEADP